MRILYFAWVRETVGLDAEEVSFPPEVLTVADAIDRLALRSPAHAAALADRGRVRAALDQRFAQGDEPVGAARELSLFPPVTGG